MTALGEMYGRTALPYPERSMQTFARRLRLRGRYHATGTVIQQSTWTVIS